MSRAIFGFPSRTGSFVNQTLGLWESAYPRTNLRIMPLSRVARTQDLVPVNTRFRFIAAANASVSVGIAALVQSNLSINATIQFRMWANTDGTTLLFNSTALPAYPAGFTGSLVGTTLYRAADQNHLIGAMQIDIIDETNPDGYVQIGYCEVAEMKTVEANFITGANYGFRWRSEMTEALGGGQYFQRLPKPRILRGTFQPSRNEAMNFHYEMQKTLDLNLPVLVVPRPSETAHLPRTVMLARLKEPGLASMAYSNRDTVPFSLEEVID